LLKTNPNKIKRAMEATAEGEDPAIASTTPTTAPDEAPTPMDLDSNNLEDPQPETAPPLTPPPPALESAEPSSTTTPTTETMSSDSNVILPETNATGTVEGGATLGGSSDVESSISATATAIPTPQETDRTSATAITSTPSETTKVSKTTEAGSSSGVKRPFSFDTLELPKRQRGRPLTQMEKELRKERMGRKWVRRRVIDPFHIYLLEEVGIRESTAQAYCSLAASIIHEVCDTVIEKELLPHLTKKNWEDSRKVLAYHEDLVREMLANRNPRYSAVLAYLVKYADREDRRETVEAAATYEEDDESIDMSEESIDMEEDDGGQAERSTPQVANGGVKHEGSTTTAVTNLYSHLNGEPREGDSMDHGMNGVVETDGRASVEVIEANGGGGGGGGGGSSNGMNGSKPPVGSPPNDVTKKRLQRSNRVLREGTEALEVQYSQLKQARDKEMVQRIEAEKQLEAATKQIQQLQRRLESIENVGGAARDDGGGWVASNRIDQLEHELAELRRRNAMMHRAHVMYVSALTGGINGGIIPPGKCCCLVGVEG